MSFFLPPLVFYFFPILSVLSCFTCVYFRAKAGIERAVKVGWLKETIAKRLTYIPPECHYYVCVCVRKDGDHQFSFFIFSDNGGYKCLPC